MWCTFYIYKYPVKYNISYLYNTSTANLNKANFLCSVYLHFFGSPPLRYSRYNSPTCTCVFKNADILLKYAWPGTLDFLNSGHAENLVKYSELKKNCLSAIKSKEYKFKNGTTVAVPELSISVSNSKHSLPQVF